MCTGELTTTFLSSGLLVSVTVGFTCGIKKVLKEGVYQSVVCLVTLGRHLVRRITSTEVAGAFYVSLCTSNSVAVQAVACAWRQLACPSLQPSHSGSSHAVPLSPWRQIYVLDNRRERPKPIPWEKWRERSKKVTQRQE